MKGVSKRGPVMSGRRFTPRRRSMRPVASAPPTSPASATRRAASRSLVATLMTIVLAVAAGAAQAGKKHHARFDSSLPVFGTRLSALPEGRGKESVETSCLPCHSTDILRQQRLTEKQWTTTVEKMVRWGAVLKEEQKAEAVRYLFQHYGPDNRFVPVRTRPIGF